MRTRREWCRGMIHKFRNIELIKWCSRLQPLQFEPFISKRLSSLDPSVSDGYLNHKIPFFIPCQAKLNFFRGIKWRKLFFLSEIYRSSSSFIFRGLFSGKTIALGLDVEDIPFHNIINRFPGDFVDLYLCRRERDELNRCCLITF